MNRRPNAPQYYTYTNIREHFRISVEAIDWNHYKKWLANNKSKYYARFLLWGSKKWKYYAFSNELVELSNDRKREDILKVATNLTRYLDIHNDSNFHEEFLRWIKRKEIRWKSNRSLKIPQNISIELILDNMKNLQDRYRIFSLFALVSGLRTFECIKVLNNHNQLCNDGIIEMYWDRGTKKTNAVFCHPLLHKKIQYKYNENTIHRNLPSKILGCQIRYLRKLNFTLIATKLDPLLAEFMQGRRGNVSQRHYFLPMMNQYRKKWIKIWEKKIQST